LLAQITSEVITQVISSLGVVGALVWYLWHNTTVTIPGLTKTHSDAMEKITEKFSVSLADERKQRIMELEMLKTWITNEASCKFREQSNRADHNG
jgi:hypothetical protein